jgi:hypothetical protein
MATVVKN